MPNCQLGNRGMMPIVSEMAYRSVPISPARTMSANHKQDLLRLAARVESGETLALPELIPHVGNPDPKARLEAFLTLANAYMRRGDETRAGQLIERAWWLSGQAPDLLDTYIYFKLKTGDITAIRNAYKHLGMVAARSGKVAEALERFTQWQHAYPVLLHQDHYEYDYEILDAIDQLAAPRRFQPSKAAPGPNEKIRLAFLMYGTTQFNSVIVPFAKMYAQYQDRERFEVAFFVPEAASAVRTSPQGEANLDAIRAQGWRVVVMPDMHDAAEGLYQLASEIYDFKPHLLILQAGLAELHHHYIRALRPAALTLGMLHGPPAQFIAPDLDWAIAWTWHTLMDCPVPCSHMITGWDLPDPPSLKLKSRAEVGLPADAVLLAAAGRHIKFQNPVFWQLLASALTAHPKAWFMAIGLEESQVEHHLSTLPGAVRQRIRFFPWMAKYLEVLGNADVLLDTYPSGGGTVFVDAMALGIPVLAFDNDYLKPFDQVEWSLAQELMPECDLVVPRGNQERYLSVVSKLISDTVYRKRMGDLCQRHVRELTNKPVHLVRRCEEIYTELCKGGASPAQSEMAAAPAATSTPSPMSSDSNRRPFFSILVPTYNQAQYLPVALDSLLAQTFTDWEAVVVNDGSTDDTAAILDAYARRDPRIRAVHKENGGTASALNEALRQSRGQWIGWLSSDDLFESDKLAVHVEAIRLHPETRFFHTNFYELDDSSGRKYPGQLDVAKHIPVETHQLIQLFGFNYLNGITVVVDRALFEVVGGFNPRYRGGQDFDMWLRLSARCRSRFIDRRLSVTRLHPGQDTQKSVMVGIIDCGVACLDFLNRHPFAELFPALDLSQVESAVAAIQAVLGIVLDARSNIRTCGFSAPLIERMAEWLAHYPNREFVDALCQMIQESAAEPAVEPEVGVLLRGFASRVAAATSYSPCDPIELLGRRAEQLRERGEQAMAGTFEQYIEQYRLRLHEAAPSIAPVEVGLASLG